MTSPTDDLISAIKSALAGEWDDAHAIAQRHEGDPTADWLHAVLHKIEGDTANSRYWYGRTDMTFDRFPDPKVELRAIFHDLVHERRN